MAQEKDSRTALMPDAGQPLVLVGPPRDVRGEFRVRNTTARKVIVREPRLTPAVTRRAKTAAAALPEAALALRRIVVRPGQARPVPVSLSLDPRTPPGTYHAELDVGGEQRAVVLHVTEDVALSIAPAELVLPNRGTGKAQKIQKQVVITNEGNVPVTVKAVGTVVLDEELAHCRALRGALADAGDTMKSLDDFAVALGRRYRALYETLALRVQNEEIAIAAGETQAIELTITLPDKLEPRSRYTGYAAISTGTLTFTIVPG